MLDPPAIPEPDELSAPFFEGLARGVLMVQRCAGCGLHMLGGLYCSACGSDALSWRAASGRGVVWSFVVMHIAYNPAHADQVPYNAACIELAEGPRLFAEVLEAAPGALTIGEPVAFAPLEAAPGRFVPAFRRLR
jgi:uncharacterized OB-fold protein